MCGKLTMALAGLGIVGHAAVADEADALVRTFAYCAGRFSAEVEHAWLMQHVDPAPAERRREATLLLLATLVDDPDSGPALEYRILAKHAHASLLQEAAFHPEPAMARRAERLAATRIRACSSLLLS